ncbi:MAG: enoyl-CoA hydratase/isomerase family protein [Gammaproteobacteria bacterium]|nr:enoyl-CoA hydratase/isomerase family protein [Gammaproteobacteria bacterium]
MSDSAFSTLQYEVIDNTAKIILDRPPANLINKEMTLEYHSALKKADSDPDVRVIVLAGNGNGLSGGVDLNYVENFDSSEMEEFLRLFYIGTMAIVRGLSKPIIAAIHGYAREGACTLAFACDMIIAADDADFVYHGVPKLKETQGMHVWILQRLIGRMKAAELIFTGKSLGAAQAERMGLITKVVGAGSLMYEAEKMASKIAEMSPLALKRTRDLLYQMEDMDFQQVPETAVLALSSAFDSEDSREARKAYIEKRKPVWTGR